MIHSHRMSTVHLPDLPCVVTHVPGGSEYCQHINFIPKLHLAVLQANALEENKHSKTHKTTEFIYTCSRNVSLAYLFTGSNDKDTTQDQAFTFHVPSVASAISPPDVPPHTDTKEHGEKHPSLLGAVEVSLFESDKSQPLEVNIVAFINGYF